jgi:hypothetical protein
MRTDLRDDDLLRVREIVRDPRTGHEGLVPVGRSKWLALAKAGKIPKPIRIGTRGVFWRWADVRRVRDEGIA